MIEPTNEMWDDIQNSQLMLMEFFQSQEMTENDVEIFMATQTCSNCDNEGHILENCPLLYEQNKFKLQCLTCHTPNVTSEACENCQKN